jgi:hypothetical protein
MADAVDDDDFLFANDLINDAIVTLAEFVEPRKIAFKALGLVSSKFSASQ